MKLFGYDLYKNVDKPQKPKDKIITNIKQAQLLRSRQDIKKWRSALAFAENIKSPNRTELLRLYQDVVLDSHLSALMDTIKNNILNKKFSVFDTKGDVNDEKTSLIKKEWFYKFIEYCLDSTYYGFSLIQFGEITNDEFKDIELVPRDYVVPEESIVKLDKYGNKKLSYIENEYSKWLIFVGEKKDLGLLNKACPLIIWKKLVLGAWSEFNELFGVPIRIGRTDMYDDVRKEKMEDMLDNMGSAAWGVFHTDDNIQLLEGNKGGNFNTFDQQIKMIDQQLSKMFTGQTMVLDDGSSRSQSEVHERNFDQFIEARFRWLEFVINNKLFPLMSNLGIAMDGFRFEWEFIERVSIIEQAKIDAQFMPYLDYDIDYLKKKYNIEVSQKVPTEATNEATNMITEDVAKIYKGFFDIEK